MKFSVVISNRNYAQYLQECVDSVLAQTLAPHEIIVMDDDSDDDSVPLLRERYGTNPLIRIISQTRNGQIMAVARGIEQASGDIICLLDADDRYKPAYLQELSAHYAKNPHVDLTFCRFESFGAEPFENNDNLVWPCPPADYDCGCSALLIYFGKITWFGNVTSTLSLRTRMARRLNLREAAMASYALGHIDVAVLLGTSFLGGVKYYLYNALVDYRSHPQSVSNRSKKSTVGNYQKKFFHHTTYNYYRNRSGISDDMRSLLQAEATTIPSPTPEHLKLYEQPKPPSLALRAIRYLVRRLNSKFDKQQT